MAINHRQVLGRRAGSYSQGVAVPAGRLVFISGQVPVDDSGNVVGSDITTQARDVFNKIRQLLEEAGGSMADITKITAYLTDISQIAEYGKVRAEAFGPDYPASASVEVSALVHPGLFLEVEAIAVI